MAILLRLVAGVAVVMALAMTTEAAKDAAPSISAEGDDLQLSAPNGDVTFDTADGTTGLSSLAATVATLEDAQDDLARQPTLYDLYQNGRNIWIRDVFCSPAPIFVGAGGPNPESRNSVCPGHERTVKTFKRPFDVLDPFRRTRKSNVRATRS